MLAARMHGYKQALVLEGIKVPKMAPEDINENIELLRVGDIIGRAVIVFDVPWEGLSAPAA